jgi:hypothetical protein
MTGATVGAIPLSGALRGADDDALGAGRSCLAFDCHNEKEKKLA